MSKERKTCLPLGGDERMGRRISIAASKDLLKVEPMINREEYRAEGEKGWDEKRIPVGKP